ncbi:MAG: serine hydrolase domain-containing protein [Pyrinomonadaceae bacterium]
MRTFKQINRKVVNKLGAAMNKSLIFSCLFFLLSSQTAIAQPAKLSARIEITDADKIDAFVTAEMEKSHTPGLSLAIVQNGKAVYAKGYGMANLELSVAASANTEYELLSVGKQFTAAAIMLVVEEHKISLNDKITLYLPNVPAVWGQVTVRNLLSHTSGIPDYTTAPDWRQNIRLDRSPQDLIKPVMSLPFTFAPGEKWEYSNTNYYLLGMIIEKISGKSYAEYLNERIFRPLGMNGTRVNDLRDVIQNRSSGYHWQANRLQNAEYVSPTQKWAAGSVISTANDMAIWAMSLETEKLLKKQTVQLMQTAVRLNNGEETKYGFANELDIDHGHRVAGHQGGGLAFNATLLDFPDDRLTVIVLCNLTQAPSQKIARHIASFYLPAISDENNQGITDTDQKLSEILKGVLIDAAKGKANADIFAPESREKLIPFIQRVGPSFLGSLGELKTFSLLDERKEPQKIIRRYRAVFANQSIIWKFELTATGKILSMEPIEE